MNDTDEGLMTRYLFGVLDAAERDRLIDRLGEDESYFEKIAAFEDDLILRYFHGQLNHDEKQQFERAYLTSPVRRARVDEALTLIAATETVTKGANAAAPSTAAAANSAAAATPGGPNAWTRLIAWLTAPFSLPRYALVGAGVVLIAAVSLTVYLARTSAPFVAAFTLTAEGMMRGSDGAQGPDRLVIDPRTDELRLSVPIDADLITAAGFEAEVTPVDAGVTIHALPSIVKTGSGTIATVALSAPPDGDYVLTLRRTTDRGRAVVATHAFRVMRSPLTGRS